MKSALKWIVIFIIAFIMLYAFSPSYYSQNIDHLDYVIAIGIDTVPNSEDIKITFEFANLGSFSENASSTQTEPIINSIVAPSISNAETIMNAYIGKQLNLSHCKVIVFSKEFAQKGVLNEVSVLIHDIQVRPTTNVVISECEATKYLKSSTSSLEQVLTKYYDIFPTSSEYTGYTSNIPLGEFYENLLNDDIGAVTILGKKVDVVAPQQSSSNSESQEQSSQNSESQENQSTSKNNISSNNLPQNTTIENTIDNNPNYQSFDPSKAIVEGDRGAENMGLAVFKNDKMIGDLSTIETLCYSLLKDEVDHFLITINNPINPNQKIDINIASLSQSNIDINIENENPIINIELNFTAEVLNMINTSDLSYDEAIQKINDNLKSYLTKEFKDYLYKTSKEYKTDINEFYTIAKRKFLTNSDFEKYNWEEKYQNAKFNIYFKNNIITTLIIE